LRRAGLEVIAAGLTAEPVTGSRGVVLMPDVALDDVLEQDFDMVVLPGGKAGAEALAQDARIIQLLKRHHMAHKWTGAICAAPLVLAKAGLLDGLRATAYPGVLESLNIQDFELTASSVEQDGRIVTSKGPGTAMDFALTLIELLLGAESRKAVEAPLQRPHRQAPAEVMR
jgi:protein deglycase